MDLVQKYIQNSIINKIFSKDIKFFNIEKEHKIKSLYKFLLQNTAQTFSQLRTSSDLGISRNTIKKYSSILDKAFLITYLDNFLKSHKAREKSFQKSFSESLNFLGYLLNIQSIDNLFIPGFKGHIIENYVLNQLTKITKGISQIYYFNKNNKEVDFIIETKTGIKAIEVKSKSKINTSDTKHLFNFLEKNNLNSGFIFYGGNNSILKANNKTIYLVNYL